LPAPTGKVREFNVVWKVVTLSNKIGCVFVITVVFWFSVKMFVFVSVIMPRQTLLVMT